MAFPYKHFLVIGATAGIGRALAARLVESGAKVTVVGRRQDRLNEFVQTVEAARARCERFDIGEPAQIPDFAAKYDVFPAPSAASEVTLHSPNVTEWLSAAWSRTAWRPVVVCSLRFI